MQASYQEAVVPGAAATMLQPEPSGEIMEGGPAFEGEMLGPACGDGGCGCEMQACCPTSKYWVDVDYLAWWMSSMPVPALVTTSPATTPQEQAGVIGFSTTSLLFGPQGVNGDGRSGARIALGRWLDPCESRGVEVSYMTLGRGRETFSASNNEYPVLARPFFNLTPGLDNVTEDSRLIAYPNVVSGTVLVDATTELHGLEVSVTKCAMQSCFSRTDAFVGYRWVELKDDLLIGESTLSLSGSSAGTTIDLFDQFNAQNTFHGGQIGVIHHRQIAHCWSIELVGKIALGNSHSRVAINGQTTTTAGGETSTHSGGLLTQGTNIGTYERNSFAAITELGAQVRRQIGRNLMANFGYTFFYWSDVGRAGDQIDRELNLTQVPPGTLVGAPRPHFRLQTTDFWAQGINLGLEYSF